MASDARIRQAFADLIARASLDPDAETQPRDERVAFPRDRLEAAWRLLDAPADYDRAVTACESLMRESIGNGDLRGGLAALKLIQKLEAAGARHVYREGDYGLEQID